MKVVHVDPALGAALQGVGGRQARLNPFAKGDSAAFAALLHLGPGGQFGPHAATVPRAVLLVRGEGEVRAGAASPGVKLTPGDALFWEAGESLTLSTAAGLFAVVIEVSGLTARLT